MNEAKDTEKRLTNYDLRMTKNNSRVSSNDQAQSSNEFQNQKLKSEKKVSTV